MRARTRAVRRPWDGCSRPLRRPPDRAPIGLEPFPRPATPSAARGFHRQSVPHAARPTPFRRPARSPAVGVAARDSAPASRDWSSWDHSAEPAAAHPATVRPPARDPSGKHRPHNSGLVPARESQSSSGPGYGPAHGGPRRRPSPRPPGCRRSSFLSRAWSNAFAASAIRPAGRRTRVQETRRPTHHPGPRAAASPPGHAPR